MRKIFSLLAIKQWPLWLQVNLVMLIMTITVTSVAGWLIQSREGGFQHALVSSQAQQMLSVLRATSLKAFIGNDRLSLDTIIAEIVKTNKNIEGLYYFDRSGKIVTFWHGDGEQTHHVTRYKEDVIADNEKFGSIELEWRLDDQQHTIDTHIITVQTIIVSALILLSIAITVIYHFFAIWPINTIYRRLRQLANGDFATHLDDGTSKELSRLNQSVNTLSKVLASQEHGSRQQQEILEKQVSKRTAELNKLYEQMKFQALHDPLTQLPNRVLLIDRLTHAITRSKRYGTKTAVLFIDLDRFKTINDTYGHLIGDELIKAVAQLLRTSLRDEDTVARFAGDEFVCVLYDIKDKSNAALVAEKLSNTICSPTKIGDIWIETGASIGVSLFPDNASEPEILLKNADVAMYQAKRNSARKFAFYQDDIGMLSHRQAHLENDLKLAHKSEQLHIVYQPIRNLISNTIVAVEALVRWEHPKFGLLTPGEFVPVAEEIGVIQEIDLWVLENASKQIADFNSQHGTSLLVSINFSSRNFESSDLVSKVNKILNSISKSKPVVQIEITENTYLRESETVLDNIAKLKQSGIKIAVDDFGAGYASFAYLARLPIDTVKIDKQFLTSMQNNRNSQTITQAIINLGNKLGLTVVAEGVENSEQENFLIKNRCINVQGFLYGRPHSAQQLRALFGT